MLFRCTKKVISALRLTGRDLEAGANQSSGELTEWYCNLFHVKGRKCLLFTQGTTLFSFVVPGVVRTDLDDFGRVFRHNAGAALFSAGFSAAQARLLVDHGPGLFGRTESRIVLGSMADQVRICKFYAAYAEDFGQMDFEDITRRLNGTPMSPLGNGNPASYLRNILALRDVPLPRH